MDLRERGATGNHKFFPDVVPTLTDGEVTLRAHLLSDVDGLFTQCKDPETTTWTTLPVPYTEDVAVMYTTKCVPDGWYTGTDFAFAVDAKHDDGVRRYAGSVSLHPHGDGVAEIAYGVHPAARGTGVCQRAVNLLLDWGFQQQGYEVVTWYAHVGNWASRRVAWVCGFTITGTIPKLLVQRGVRRDAWVGSLRADDPREPRHPWHVPPVLESGRLRLRPARESDADRLAEATYDDRSRHFMGRVTKLQGLDGLTLIRRDLEANARGERFDWCITGRDSDQLIGHIQVSDLGGLDDTAAKLGYAVHPDSRGRGVVTEALRLVVEWAFRPVVDGGLGKRRLWLSTAESNTASRHAAERVGFVHIATEPETFTIGTDGFEGKVIYHRLNPDWRPTAPRG